MIRNIENLNKLNNDRYDYSKISGKLALPNLVEIQTKSYAEFKEKGLDEVFRESFPIVNYTNTLSIDYVSIRFGEPKHTFLQCKAQDLTYSAPIYVMLRLTHHDTGEIQESEVYMGEFPLMTKSGTFIVNGAVAKYLYAYQVAVWSTDVLFFNLLCNMSHLVDVELTGGHHYIGKLGIVLHGFQVGDIALGGHVDLNPDLTGILDDALVGSDDGGDAVGLDGIQQLVHLFHFLVVNDGVDGNIALHAVSVAGFSKLPQIVQSKVLGRP